MKDMPVSTKNSAASVVREETFVLLEFLGPAPENSPFTLGWGQNLTGSAIKDVLFLALHIGGIKGGPVPPGGDITWNFDPRHSMSATAYIHLSATAFGNPPSRNRIS
jgi:hypothetical protein